MSAVNFPSSPSNGDTLTSGNTTYTYNSTKTRWDAVTTVNGIQLNSLSVGAEAAASGDGGIAYDNTSGEFTYTPPVIGDSGASVAVSATAPSSAGDGDMWIDSATLVLYVYYNDGSSSQWVEVYSSSSGGDGGGGGTTFSEAISSVTMAAGSTYILNTSTALTLTLPAAAAIGDKVGIIDGTGQASTNNITIARNGHKIQGLSEDMTVAKSRAAFELVYYNTSNGWLLTSV